MLFQPAIMALLLVSLVSSVMAVATLPFAVRVLRRWDLASGSETQLAMERRTYLASTVVKLVLVAELAALLLFVFNADRMAAMFTGAMCAVGTLNVNGYGFPALYLKITVFFLAAVWLALDHVDGRGYDYPLVRVKYAALLGFAPVMLAASAVQLAYFLGLRADVITSCCSTLFSGGGVTVGKNALASLPHDVALPLLAVIVAATFVTGVHVLRWGHGGSGYAALSGATFLVAIAAVVSTVSVYVYELPHHHCPFCLLKSEYGHVGYALYVPLFAATAFGFAAGITGQARVWPSLAAEAPTICRRFTRWSMAGYLAFVGVSAWLIERSHLVLFESFTWRGGAGP